MGWPAPPPPPPSDDGGFTAPPPWERGRPIEPRARGFSDIVEAAFTLYRLHWRALMGLVAVLVVPFQFLDQYLTRNYRHVALLGARAGSAQSGRLAAISLVLSSISLLVVQPLLTAGLVRAAAGFHLGEDPTAGDVLEEGLPLIGPVLLVIVLYSLVVFGGFLLLVVPGIVFFIRFLFAPAVVVVENVRGRAALRRSWQLTRRNWWRVFGITLVAGLMAGVASSFLSVPALLAARKAGEAAWIVRGAGLSAAQVIATPFSLLVQVLLYFDLRVRADGLDLDRLSRELHRRW